MNTMNNMANIRSGNMKIAIAFITMFSLTACNAIGGLGKDIQGAAEYTSNKINNTQPEKKNSE